MRGIIVDCWEKDRRVAQLKGALSQFDVDGCFQLSEEAEEEWASVVEEVRELTKRYDFVLLHAGDEQKFRLQLLEEICQSRPVFCYSGGPVLPAIAEHCQEPGLHVLSAGQFSRSDAGTLPTLILRWLKVLGPVPSHESAIAAWQEVRRIDPEKEKQIQELDARLLTLLRQHK